MLKNYIIIKFIMVIIIIIMYNDLNMILQKYYKNLVIDLHSLFRILNLNFKIFKLFNNFLYHILLFHVKYQIK